MASDVADPVSDREIRHHDLPIRDLSERARALVTEAEVTDREHRFGHRHASVRDAVAKRSVRARQLTVAAGITLAAVGAAVGEALTGLVGAVIGATLPVLLFGSRALMQRAARQRGAEGYDWRTGRHVLTTNPSREVQDWDNPKNH